MILYQELLTALYASLPRWYARMQPAGSLKKYLKVYHPVTVRLGELHWQGTITVAAPLVGQEGQGQAAAVDFDAGGEPVIRAWLTAAAAHGYVAWGSVATGSDGHDGGHVWLLFDQPAAPAQLRMLLTSIGHAAGHPSQELYPSGKALRLPFGVHTWTQRWGSLVLQDGQRYELDDSAQRDAALATVLALPRNASATLPVPPTPVYPARNAPVTLGATGSIIDAYNQGTDLVWLLESYGAKIAEQWSCGALLHCPCPGHRHGDRRPSMQIMVATTSTAGRWVAVGYSPTCWFYTGPGQVVRSFDVFFRMEHLTPREAVRRLTRGHEV